MQIVIAFSRWALPLLAVLILAKCLLALLFGQPKEKTYGYLIDKTDGERYALNMWETSIGRSNSCDIVIGYGTVSRFQAVISRRIDGWYVFDLRSKSGISVNGEAIEAKAQIRAGDELTFGGVQFGFFVTDDPVIRVGKKKRLAAQQAPATPKQPADSAPLFSYDTFYDETNKPALNFEKPLPQINPAYLGEQQIETPRRTQESAKRVVSRPALQNPDTGETFILTGNHISIGRAAGNDIRLASPAVSRRHAALILYEDGWAIEDCNSTQGTYLNNAKVTAPQLLFGGDILRFGDTILRYQAGRARR